MWHPKPVFQPMMMHRHLWRLLDRPDLSRKLADCQKSTQKKHAVNRRLQPISPLLFRMSQNVVNNTFALVHDVYRRQQPGEARSFLK
jgi:hypothetical protein